MRDITNNEMIPIDALSYEAFGRKWTGKLAAGHKGLDRATRKNWFYAKYNAERSQRVVEQLVLDEDVKVLLSHLPAQSWMVITEDWCVDSAFILPVIAELAAQNPNIELRIVPRDAHPEVMDRYLTNGTRSIPKLVVLDASGDELFQWGPRPQSIVAFRQQLVDAGEEKGIISKKVIAAYEAGAWRDVVGELTMLLEDQMFVA